MLTVMEEHPLKWNAGMFFRLSVEVEGALAVLIVMVLVDVNCDGGASIEMECWNVLQVECGS